MNPFRRKHNKRIEGDHVVFSGTCFSCNKPWELRVTTKQHDDWLVADMYVQDAMPNLSKGERELLISSTCDECFNKMFTDVEEVP